MEFKNWITHVQAPGVERLLKKAALGDQISFAGALPDSAMFPAQQIEEAFQHVISNKAAEALQYYWSEGYEPLRQQISEFMRKRNVRVKPDEILITSGAQQALDLLAKLLIKPGVSVALESPTYMPAIQVFELQHPKFSAISRTDSELDFDNLREVCGNNEVAFVYVVSTGHNPTGGSLSLDQRHRLLRIADEFNVPLVEDLAYGELQYDNPQPSLASISTDPSRVIYVGSFSKVLSPGLRIGWIAAPLEMIKQLALIKQATDLQASSLSQMVLSQYLKTNDFDTHLNTCVEFYGQRRDTIMNSLKRFMPPETEWSRPVAGFSLWVKLPPHISAEECLKVAIDRGVAFEPGGPFFATEKHQNFFRLSFSAIDPAQIREGIERLAKLIADEFVVRAH